MLILPVYFFVAGCASSHPLGMNEEQWKALTPNEREKLLLQQQKYREEQRLAQIEANARAQELQHQRHMAEQKRLQALYDNPVNGNVVMLNILGGTYIYGKRSKKIKEETYQIARGEIQKIKLILEDRKNNFTTTENVYLEYALNGNGVYLYLDNPSYNSNRYERIALLRDGDWNCGTYYEKNINTSYKKLKKVQLFVKETGSRCAYPNRIKPRKHYR